MRYVVFGVVLCAVLVARDMRYVVFGLVLCAVLVARDTRRLLFGLVLPMLGELDFANEVRFAHALMSAVASLLFRGWRGGFGGPGRPCRVFIFIRHRLCVLQFGLLLHQLLFDIGEGRQAASRQLAARRPPPRCRSALSSSTDNPVTRTT